MLASVIYIVILPSDTLIYVLNCLEINAINEKCPIGNSYIEVLFPSVTALEDKDWEIKVKWDDMSGA